MYPYVLTKFVFAQHYCGVEAKDDGHRYMFG